MGDPMFRPAREPQSKRHIRNSYYVLGEGIFNDPGTSDGAPVEPLTPSTIASLRKFRFSRLSPAPGTTVTSRELREALAKAMTPATDSPDSSHPAIPAGFTYLGQFVDHDLTLDATGRDLEQDVTVDELIQGRSPALDLDSLYGRGPQKPQDRKFYGPDGIRLRTGKTQAVGGRPDGVNDVPQKELDGFDLPRVGIGSSIGERRAALIPDARNDENLAVAQIHCAFIRFHNKVVSDLIAQGTDSAVLFDTARELVVKHYQWMLRTDYLIQIVDDQIVDDVFHHGRRYFDVAPEIKYDDGGAEDETYRKLQPGDAPTMPIEFSVAAFRLGHSMVREEYEWNRVFNSGQGPGVLAPATLRLIFVFSATSGNFQPFPPDDDNPDAGRSERLPTNWVADLPGSSTSARPAARSSRGARTSSTWRSGSTPCWSTCSNSSRWGRSAPAGPRSRRSSAISPSGISRGPTCSSSRPARRWRSSSSSTRTSGSPRPRSSRAAAAVPRWRN